MRRWVWLVVAVVAVSSPAFAAGKKKGKDKEAPAAEEAKQSTPGLDAVRRADEKVAEGQVELAIDILRTAVSKEGMTGEPFLRLGQLLESTMDTLRAIEAYNGAAERLAGAPKGEALARISFLHELNAAMAEADAAADAAMAADSEGPMAAIALSRARARQGKGDEALALAEKARAAGGAAALTAIGFAQEARGDLAAAEAAYREALAGEPDRPLANLGLARVLRRTGRAAEADPRLARVTEKTPWLLEAYKESVLVKIALGQFVAAMEQAQTAAALAGDDPLTARMVADVKLAQALDYIQKGQSDLAIEDLTNLLAQRPDMVPARIALGRAYIARRQVDEALAELQKALAAEPNAAEAHFQIGVIQQDLKRNPSAAIAAFEKAVSLDPGNAEYAIRLGVALSAEKQGAKAVAVLGKSVQGPAATRPDAWTYLAGAHLVAAQYQDVVRTGLQALQLLDAQPETAMTKGVRGMACDYLAWAYINLKDRDNAIKYGAQARTLGFKDPDLSKRVSDLEAGMQFKEDAAKPAVKRPPAKRRPTGTRR